jgi:hypothetical protein
MSRDGFGGDGMAEPGFLPLRGGGAFSSAISGRSFWAVLF